MSTEALKESLSRIQSEPEWQMLWEHLMTARQGLLLRMTGASNWEQFLEMRGEFNALNVVIDFGDMLLERIEEAELQVQEDAGRTKAREFRAADFAAGGRFAGKDG